MNLFEAFKKLESLDEETFSVSDNGIQKLAEFEQADDSVDNIEVYDLDATDEEELQDSYVGDVILDCSVCHSKLYKNKDDVVIDEEVNLANVGQECPYCYSVDGYKVIGQVAPMDEDSHGEDCNCEECVDSKQSEDNLEECDKKDDSLSEAYTIGDEIEQYQQWVDYDMKRYGKVSEQTQREIKEAGLQLIKDQYGDYEVSAGSYKAESFDEGLIESLTSILTNLTEDQMSDEDRKDSDLIRSMLDKLKKRSNAKFTPEEEAVLKKYNIERNNDSRNLSVDNRNLSRDIDTYRGGRYSKPAKDGDVSKINYADRARKLPQRKDNQVFTAPYTYDNDDINAHGYSKSRYSTLQAADRAAQNVPMETKMADMKNALRDRKYAQSNIDNAEKNRAARMAKAQADFDKAKSQADWQYNYDTEYSTRVKNRAQDKIDTLLRRNKEESFLEERELSKIDGTVGSALVNHKNELTNAKSVEDIISVLDSLKSEVREGQQGYLASVIQKVKKLPFNRALQFVYNLILKGDNLSTRLVSSLEESVEEVEVKTDDTKIEVSSDEDGKVTVTTEPRRDEDSDGSGEIIEPISDETKMDIENNDVDIDVDEFDEETFDDLGESYLKQVYDNVESYHTNGVTSKDNKFIVEGVITFNSGSKKKTSFIFEGKDFKKSGRVRLIGENKEITRGNKAFTLTGKVDNKKFIIESLNYNYKTKNSIGKSTRLYGTIKKG